MKQHGISNVEGKKGRTPERFLTYFAIRNFLFHIRSSGRSRIIPACLFFLLFCPTIVCIALDEAQVIERLNKASQCLAQKQWNEAAAIYREILKSNPDNPYALVGVARHHLGQKRFKKAIELLERAQKHLPGQEEFTNITEWHLIGPFPNPGEGEGLNIAYPPEKEIKLEAVYDGKPGDVAASRAAMAKVKESCTECHAMCRGKGTEVKPATQVPCKIVLPKTFADIPQFVNGLNDMRSVMMAMQMASDMGTTATQDGAVDVTAFMGAIMRAVQTKANKMLPDNKPFVASGKKFCEATKALDEAAKVQRKAKWEKRTRDEVIGIEKSMPLGNVVFYGLAEIDSDKDQVVELRVGSDDGCKVWFNDQLVWTNATRRAVNPDQDRIFVRMRKGKNKLLMKIEQGLGQYGMGAKIVRAMSVAGALQFARQEYDKVKNQALARMSSKGLKPDSQGQYWILKKGRCVKVGMAGRVETLPPGKYEVRVGFPSGYLEREFDLKAGEEFTVPTGLFTFKEVTPSSLASTVPQKLYHLETGTYLVTGYQAATARLYPGKYRVCYQDMNDETPSIAFGPWHVIGPFPNDKNNKGFFAAYPPEQQPIPDLKKTVESMGQTIGWRPIENFPEIDIANVIPGWGVAYATATIESDADRDLELVLTYRGGLKVWLNGKLIKEEKPRGAYYGLRTATFTKLNKGPSVLFVKTYRAAADWPLSAVAIRWKMYDVDVVEGKDDE